MDQVICNCYDAGALQTWAGKQGYSLTCLRSTDTGRIFVRGLVFCPEYSFDRLRKRTPGKFRLSPLTGDDGGPALCSASELDGLLERVDKMTRQTPHEEEVMILPKVGDIVQVNLPPVLNGVDGEVTRVSPNTGNVRLSIAGKFWSVSWKALNLGNV